MKQPIYMTTTDDKPTLFIEFSDPSTDPIDEEDKPYLMIGDFSKLGIGKPGEIVIGHGNGAGGIDREPATPIRLLELLAKELGYTITK